MNTVLSCCAVQPTLSTCQDVSETEPGLGCVQDRSSVSVASVTRVSVAQCHSGVSGTLSHASPSVRATAPQATAPSTARARRRTHRSRACICSTRHPLAYIHILIPRLYTGDAEIQRTPAALVLVVLVALSPIPPLTTASFLRSLRLTGGDLLHAWIWREARA